MDKHVEECLSIQVIQQEEAAQSIQSCRKEIHFEEREKYWEGQEEEDEDIDIISYKEEGEDDLNVDVDEDEEEEEEDEVQHERYDRSILN